ncbi:hypothetical protein IWX47DRAFT_677915 [Phyllosticta citricarpa]|uniref:Uncharacterized protein n=1 Tax=Phyllosticta citricarpa TaxID=55181 RepID=A0ABR1L450_9PEZI
MTRPSSRATLSFILSRPASSAAEQIASFVAEQTCAAGKAFAADKMCAADETCTADKTSAAEQTVVCASPTVARGLPRMSWTLPARAFCLTQTPSSQRGLARSASRASSTHQGPPRRQFRLVSNLTELLLLVTLVAVAVPARTSHVAPSRRTHILSVRRASTQPWPRLESNNQTNKSIWLYRQQ